MKFTLQNVRVRSRGYMPHWEADNAFYFVTFRLHDSLPEEIVEKLRAERERILGPRGRSLSLAEQLEKDRYLSRRLDARLDLARGSCLLRRAEVADVVFRAIKFFDRDRYELDAAAVMPNHVHVQFFLQRGSDLSKVLHSWKSYTGNVINILMERSGPLWEREYYDHLVRDSEELEDTRRYIVENPVKAGLEDWPWVYVRR